MQKKYRYIFAVCLAAVLLTACEHTEISASEMPETYGISKTSMENSEQQGNDGSEYEIDDMLPRPSDDTLIISVEEAEAIMNNRKNADANTETNTSEDVENGTGQKKKRIRI